MTDSAQRRRTIRGALLSMGVSSVLLLTVGRAEPATVAPGTLDAGTLPTAPVVESFTADPLEIKEGDESMLSWVVTDPEATLRIAPLGGTVNGTTITVRPVVTTTYTLTASNAFGSTMTSVTVKVGESSSPVGTGATGDPTGSSPDSTGATGADVFATTWVDAAGNLAGRESDCGNVSFISSNPSEDMTIVGVALHGLFSITAGADEWAPLGTGDGSAEITNRLSSITYDPADPNVFWESGTYNGGGVYKTIDKGVTFTQLGDVIHSDLVAIDLTDPGRQTMLTGVHEEGTLFRSTDGGATWGEITAALPTNIGFASAPRILDSTTYLLGTQDGSDSGVFRTTDAGSTWTTVWGDGVKGAPLVTPSDGAIYWLLKSGEGMITSTDAGLTWSLATGAGPRSSLSSSLIQLPDGRIVAVGGSFLVATADKGATWDRIGPNFPYEPNGFTYAPFQKSYYAYRFNCDFEDPANNTVQPDTIIRLDVLAEEPAAG